MRPNEMLNKANKGIDYLLILICTGVMLYAGITIYELEQSCTKNQEMRSITEGQSPETIHSIQTTNLQKYYNEVERMRKAQ